MLRLVFAHLGEVELPARPRRGAPLRAPKQAADLLAGERRASRCTLVAALSASEAGADAALGELDPAGLPRAASKSATQVVRDGAGREAGRRRSIRCRWRSAGSARRRPRRVGRPPGCGDRGGLDRSTRGRVEAIGERRSDARYYTRDLTCPVCGETCARRRRRSSRSTRRSAPARAAQGFGRVIGIDRERVVPDPGKTLRERPIAPWNRPAYEELYDALLGAAQARGVPLDVPWRELSDARPGVDLARRTARRKIASPVSTRFFAGSRGAPTRCTCASCWRAIAPTRTCPDCARRTAEARGAARQVRTAGHCRSCRRCRVEELRAWLAARRFGPREREHRRPSPRGARRAPRRCSTASASTT